VPTYIDEPYTIAAPSDAILKIDSPAYGIDLQAFYLNVDDCNNGEQPSNIDIANDYPKCFFSLPIVKAADSPCTLFFNGQSDGLPESLNLNNAGCPTALLDPLGCASCP
jgi:hypothetical protein